MKKLFAALLVLVMVLGLLPMAAFADTVVQGSCADGQHNWNILGICQVPSCQARCNHEVYTTKEPDCTRGGYTTRVCSICPNKGPLDTIYHAPTTHSFANGVCTVCGAVEPEPCTNHTYDRITGNCTNCGAACNHQVTTVYGDCTDPTKYNTECCSVCKKIFSSTPVSGSHTFENGKCVRCGADEPDPDCEHDWDWTTGECEKCGATCDHPNEEVVYGKCDDPNAHNTTRCAECHKTIGSEPVSGEHNMVDGKCTRCGYEEDPDCEHDWDWTTGECTKCGATCDHPNEEVVYGNCVDPNAYETTRCADCHKVLATTPVSGEHNMVNGQCSKCGYKEDPNCVHDWDRVTGLCKKCGKKCLHPTTQTTYADCEGNGYVTEMCVVCKKVISLRPVSGKHEFKDGVCIWCGAKDPNYVPVAKTYYADLDQVPKTGDNTVVIMTAVTGIAALASAVYVVDKKRKAC